MATGISCKRGAVSRCTAVFRSFTSSLCAVVFFAIELPAQSTLDSSFNPDVTGGTVRAMVVQPDGKIVIGGDFTHIGGLASPLLARLHNDGTIDLTFSNRAVTNGVLALALQSDGKILVGSTGILTRVATDGTRDTTFPLSLLTTNIERILLQPDGKALVARRGGMLRVDGGNGVETNGFIDPTFSAPEGKPYGQQSAFSLQDDGKIVFQNGFWGTGALRRMESNGALDPNYQVDVWMVGNPTYAYISEMLPLPGNRVLVAGSFSSLNGSPRNSLAVLNSDGTVYQPFRATNLAVFTFIDAVARQTNGQIVFAAAAASIKRCSPLGTIDPTFDFPLAAESYARVTRIVTQPDGKILVAGSFTNVAGLTRRGLARIIPVDVPQPDYTPILSRFSLHPGNVIRFRTDMNLWSTNLSTWRLLYATNIAAPLSEWQTNSEPISYGPNGSYQTLAPSIATTSSRLFYRLLYVP